MPRLAGKSPPPVKFTEHFTTSRTGLLPSRGQANTVRRRDTHATACELRHLVMITPDEDCDNVLSFTDSGVQDDDGRVSEEVRWTPLQVCFTLSPELSGSSFCSWLGNIYKIQRLLAF